MFHFMYILFVFFRFPNAPLIRVEPGSKNEVYPMEVVEIAPFQKGKEPSPLETEAIMKMLAVTPGVRFSQIGDIFKNYVERNRALELFKIEADEK